MSTLALEMALRLYTNRQRGEKSSRPVLGSVLGIALSMVPLIVVLFMSDGMIRGITDRFIETSTYHIQIRSFGILSDEEMDEALTEVGSLDHVRHVFKEHHGLGMAYSLQDQTAATIRGVDPEIYLKDEGFREYLSMTEGTFRLEKENSAVIGAEIARTLNLKVGEEFRILTGKTLSTGKYIPKISRFVVEGIFTTGYQDLDKMWILVPYDRALKILQDSESLSIAGIKVSSPYDDLDPDLQDIRNLLPGRWGIYSWKTLNRSQQSNFETTRALLLFIMVLIVLVAVMNISSSMVMLVMENEQAIGIQKSMGLSPSTLSWQYVITAALAGGTGSFLGLLGGCFLTLYLNGILKGIETVLNGILYVFSFLTRGGHFSYVELLNSAYYLDEIPVHIDFSILILIFVGTVLLSILASLIPIRKAARIKPLDILRKH